jgi:hypothetical protein
MQPHFLTILPFNKIVIAFDVQRFALDALAPGSVQSLFIGMFCGVS